MGVNAAGVFSPATAGAGNHTLTYTVTQNGCTSQATRIITVNALPTVKAGDTQSVCINTAAFALAGSSPAGGSWTGKGVSANGLFNPEQAGIGTHTLTYAYSQNGCGNTATKTITVQPLPLVKAGDKQSVCIDAVAFALTGFSPAGGSWSGKGVSAGGTFTPATAGIGTHILTYTVSQNGCSNTATREITVKALPVINAGIAQTVCIDAGAFALAATPAGGSWSGKGVSAGGMFNPTAAGAGTHTLTYTVSENGCSNQAKKTVTVTPLPTVSAGNAEGVCVNASAIDLKGFSPAGGSWSGKGVSAGGTFTPATAGIGTHILTYTVSQNGCANKATKTVTVHPLPLVQAGQDLTICVSTGVFKFSDQSPLGGTWAGPGVLPDGKFDAKAAGPGTHELVYTLIQNGCSSQAKKKVTITPLPQMPEITASGPTTFCAGASLELRVQPQAGMSYKWLLNGTTTVGNEVRLEAKTSGAYTVVVYNDCAGTTSKNITITVVPAPAAPQALAARRCGPGRLTLSASGTGNGNYRWYSSAAGGTAISGETRNTFTTPSISQTTTYYVSTVNGNCESPRVAVQAIIQPLPVADAGEDKTIISGEQTTLHGIGGVKYQWSPSQGLSDPAVASPVASPAFTTTYTLTVTSAEGCTATDEITVKVLQDVSIPNTFTPNNDGTNDVWVIKNIEDYPGCTIEVFNRWGNKVYNSTGYSQPWNGTASNGQELPVTTYFYTIDLKDGKKPLVGSITIIR
jgi:gliding motility-associated-like protein